jgi:nucleoside-diphosphate-sugar epimerase
MTPTGAFPFQAVSSGAQVVRTDLEVIARRLSGEFARMAGASLLVTGGAGFLGYYLVQSALYWNDHVPPAERIRVTVYDKYVRGVPGWLMRLQHSHADLTLVRHDVCDPLPTNMDLFDYIMHAASVASPTFYRQRPIETMDANVNGLRRLLDYAVARQQAGRPISGLLFFSSSEIYGDPDPDHIPTPEDYRGNVSCTGPRACYDEAKRYGETLCVNFARHYGVPAKIVRPFNNYGPGLKISDGRVIPDFARDILANRPIVIFSDGSPTRTFCYVADAVVGYYKALLRGRPGEPYNIGVEAPEVSVRELAERMAAIARDLFGYTGSVIHQPSPDRDYLADNPSRRCPRIAKARTELGYEPMYPLNEGLRRLLLWYADHLGSDDA